MLQSCIFTFSDPSAYEAGAHLVDAELLLTSSGDFRAELMQINFERLRMERSDDTLPRILRVSIPTKRAPILFLGDVNQNAFLHGGQKVSSDELVMYGRGVTEYLRNAGPCSTVGMSLTPEDLAETGEAITGREIMVPSRTQILRPNPAALKRLRGLYDATERLSRMAPGMLTKPPVSKALEHELIHAMISCLAGDELLQAGSSGGHHARVIARYEEFLASRTNEPVYLAEICAAIAVSERTLRKCCQEYLGMSPVRYLWLRRMHLARRALLRAEATSTTVTEIATERGFWELGRFSAEYRRLFGERPSATLHRPPKEGPRRSVW
jgi:AraC-like DNA-binding protein